MSHTQRLAPTPVLAAHSLCGWFSRFSLCFKYSRLCLIEFQTSNQLLSELFHVFFMLESSLVLPALQFNLNLFSIVFSVDQRPVSWLPSFVF